MSRSKLKSAPTGVIPCAMKHLHTPCPEGYLEWHAWAEQMGRTHDQKQCPECGRYAIWEKRKR